MKNREGELCWQCHNPVSRDEIAMSKKLINRGTTRYYCTKCLADAFDVTTEDIRNKMEYFKNAGCTLFQ
ncbi:MAG: hypothetical protein Q4C59_04500 [Lachnospiraceae bacterium]|nr:hypothetical protein [Lachnospiraceae bacterium]